MTRFEIRPWNGRFDDKGVIETLRRKIRGRMEGKQCVLVDLEGVTGISPLALSRLMEGWPEELVKFCGCAESLCFPLPSDVRPTYATRGDG